MRSSHESGLRVFMLSLHGLVRGHDMELGRDPDTGGQVTYVVELARALGRHPRVASVDLLTRLIEDPAVSPDYALPVEELGGRARIVRVPFGGRRYVRKEHLWPHLDALVARLLELFRTTWKPPHVVHSHYADAGYVGAKLARALNVPLVHTGHSLGRQKRERLLAEGRAAPTIERQFVFERRIAAEEETFRTARLVVASTRQEIEEQWAAYESFDSGKCIVVPPGVDVSRFSPPTRETPRSGWIDRFLHRPEKPMIVALARPEPKKNLGRLVQAYGEDPVLREKANLVVVAGTRDDIRTCPEEVREVLTDVLLSIDRYDLFGKVAIPKTHTPEQVPDLYRLAVRRHGVFVNPALTEPFGLTLLEAAACGLPVVATEHGGPRDIVENCRNGLLVDPLDTGAIATAIRAVLSDLAGWREWSRNGIAGVARRYTWDRHVETYVRECLRITAPRPARRRETVRVAAMRPVQALLITDIDDTLVGDRASLERLLAWLEAHRETVGWGVATGRNLPQTREVLADWRIPAPDVIAASVGSEIYWGPDDAPDTRWTRYIARRFDRDGLVETLAGVEGLVMQPEECQGPYKVSYYTDAERLEPLPAIRARLRERGLRARLVASQRKYLDVIPVRASKGLATRFIARRADVPLEKVLVAGDSGNDIEMLIADTLGVVVGNHKPELRVLAGRPRVYFARSPFAAGILEGIRRWGLPRGREVPVKAVEETVPA